MEPNFLAKLLPVDGILAALCYLVPYFIIGWDVLRKAFFLSTQIKHDTLNLLCIERSG